MEPTIRSIHLGWRICILHTRWTSGLRRATVLRLSACKVSGALRQRLAPTECGKSGATVRHRGGRPGRLAR
jgi:hypothetical protein